MITLIRLEFFHHPSGNSSVTGKRSVSKSPRIKLIRNLCHDDSSELNLSKFYRIQTQISSKVFTMNEDLSPLVVENQC